MLTSAAHSDSGLTPKPFRSFWFAEMFNAISVRVDRRNTWVSAKAELILVGLTLSIGLVAAGQYTGSILASAVACWVQILLYRRAGVWLLNRVLQAEAPAHPAETAWKQLPAALADELLLASLNVATGARICART